MDERRPLHLTRRRGSSPLRRAYALPDGKAEVAEPTVSTGTIQRRALALVDVNGNGRWDDDGVDGWQEKGGDYLLPYEQPLVLGDLLVDLARVAPDALRYRVTPVEAPAEHRAALSALNAVRTRNGIAPVTHDAALSEGCRLHCLYCAANGLAHEEDPERPGYTEAGARAGPRSNVMTGTTLARAAEDAYRTFYHRRAIMQPGTRAVGFGAAHGYVAVDGLSRVEPRPWRWPVILPAPDTDGQPTAYNHGESPHPVPLEPQAGLPITLTWPQGTKIEDVRASVETAGRGSAVRAHVSWPGHPADASIPDNHDTIGVIPGERLRPRTTYRVHVEATVEGRPYERTFEFRTGMW